MTFRVGHFNAYGWLKPFPHLCPGAGCAVQAFVNEQQRRADVDEFREIYDDKTYSKRAESAGESAAKVLR